MFAVERAPSVAEVYFDAPTHASDTEENEAPKWKGKGKAVAPDTDVLSAPVASTSSVAESEVEWTKYGPPQGLMKVPDISSDVIKKVVQESVDKILARIAEEEERQIAEAKAAAEVEAETERLRQEEEERITREKNEELEVPAITVEGDPSAGDASSLSDPALRRKPVPAPQAHDASFAGVSLMVGSHEFLSPAPPVKPKKMSFKALLRRLNKSEKGESSATGAARHRHKASSGSIDSSSTLARKHLSLDTFKKVTTNSTSSPASSVHEELIECVSCLDDFAATDMVKVPCHSYCRECFGRLITAACENEPQWPPKCCLNTIPEQTVLSNSGTDLQQRYRGRAEEWNIPVSNRVYCSQPDCSLWLRPLQIDLASSIATCTSGHQTCTICRGPQHDGNNCPQDRDMMRTEELAEEEGWKRCIGCHAYVEHREACQHMTCRCGAEFCYVCGARWRTCACSMDQLAAVKTGAATRRQARIDREAAEEAEIAEALRQVEEFEREEALKAELLRQEQERLAEVRRQKELEERIKREEARRRAVEVKFQGLRETLGDLHELQRINVVCDQTKEAADLKNRAESEQIAMTEKHRSTREALEAETEAKITEREYSANAEHVARVVEERRIENEYHEQLKMHYAGKKGAELRIEKIMNELRRTMDQGFDSWDKWMNKELETWHYHLMEEQDIQLELMEAAEIRLADSTTRDLEDFAKRKIAEARWVEVVILERERMLAEMEVDETENGEDIEAWFADGALDDVVEHGPDMFDLAVAGPSK